MRGGRYAVLADNVRAVRALLASGVPVEDPLRKSVQHLSMPKKMTNLVSIPQSDSIVCTTVFAI